MFSANAAIDARYDELLRALTEIAMQRGFGEPVEVAIETRRNILRAIEREKSEKLNRWHYQQFKEKSWKKVPLRPTVEWAIVLVRRAAIEHRSLKFGIQPRLNRQQAIDHATSITLAELGPVERRAVEILCGARPKSKKNHVEDRAVRLAAVVNRDWFSANKCAGRSRGSHSFKRIEVGECFSYDVPLSITEVISAVMPSIDDLAGMSNRACIPVLPALVAAVQITLSGASRESIARLAMRVRAAGRELEKPLAE
jgi:hypothetical protein